MMKTMMMMMMMQMMMIFARGRIERQRVSNAQHIAPCSLTLRECARGHQPLHPAGRCGSSRRARGAEKLGCARIGPGQRQVRRNGGDGGGLRGAALIRGLRRGRFERKASAEGCEAVASAWPHDRRAAWAPAGKRGHVHVGLKPKLYGGVESKWKQAVQASNQATKPPIRQSIRRPGHPTIKHASTGSSSHAINPASKKPIKQARTRPTELACKPALK